MKFPAAAAAKIQADHSFLIILFHYERSSNSVIFFLQWGASGMKTGNR